MGAVGKAVGGAVSKVSDAFKSIAELAKMKYHYFTDKVSDPWNYEGSGKHAVDYMKQYTNYDELIDGLSGTEMVAFEFWTQGNFMGGQQYKGFSNMGELRQKYTRIYDKILDQATLGHGIIAARLATPELLELPKGATKAQIESQLKKLSNNDDSFLISKGNMSTGLGSKGLGIGHSSEKSIEYRIHIPEGSTGAGMWVGDSRVNDWGAKQREFMINRDTAYKVGNWSYDEASDKYVVNIYYVGRLKHDYK